MSDKAPDASRVHFASVLCVFSEDIFAVVGYDVKAETGDKDNWCPSEDGR